MISIRFSSFILFAFFFLSLIGCAQKAQPSPVIKSPEKDEIPAVKPTWQSEWEQTIAQAKKEGKMILYGNIGSEVRQVITEALKNYGIGLEIVSGRGAELTAKIFRERQIGLFLADAYMGGGTTPLVQFKPAGILEPLRPLFILPEVVDEKAYWEGKLPFTDKDGTLFQLMLTVQSNSTLINTDAVKEGQITSYYDLLQPKWKGRIVLNDPTISGKANSYFSRVIYNKKLDLKYWTELLSKQAPVITRDYRNHVEWVAQAKYYVGWAMDEEVSLEFRKLGAPIKELLLKEDVWTLASASDNLAIFSNAPHPNARKVFVNWIISKEGQALLARTMIKQGSRVDIPIDHLPSNIVRQAGVQYFLNDNADYILWRGTEGIQLAREVFTPFLR